MTAPPSAKSLASAVAALRKEEIIPEVVGEFEAQTTFAINYGNYNNAFLGNRLTVASKYMYSILEQLPHEAEKTTRVKAFHD